MNDDNKTDAEKFMKSINICFLSKQYLKRR